MIRPEEAWERLAIALAERAPSADTETVERQAACGRVLATGLLAAVDLPPRDVSALDGYALAGGVAAGSELPVVARIAAGAAPGARVPPGAAAEIWTGAPVPDGCDRVIGVEQTRPGSDGRVRILESPPLGHAVRRAGEIARAGAELLTAGSRLGPAALGLAASQGTERFAVRPLPRVAVLATGDEIVSPDREPPPGGLRDSHTDFLLAAAARVGARVRSLGIARDDPRHLSELLTPALADADLVLTCGGVSMGGADHVPAVLRELGCELLFHGVAMQPGKPLLAARRGSTLVFGLPGNPGSVMTAFRLLVEPTLARLGGRESGFWSDAFALPLAAPLPAGRVRDRFVPARRILVDGRPAARPEPIAGSHDLVSFARADLLLRVRAGEAARASGEAIEAIAF